MNIVYKTILLRNHFFFYIYIIPANVNAGEAGRRMYIVHVHACIYECIIAVKYIYRLSRRENLINTHYILLCRRSHASKRVMRARAHTFSRAKEHRASETRLRMHARVFFSFYFILLLRLPWAASLARTSSHIIWSSSFVSFYNYSLVARKCI